MSPKIQAGLDVAGFLPRSPRPLDRVRSAVQVVEAQGMRLALEGDHGVGKHAITGGWVADGPYRPRRVSLAGAVCVALQPLEGEHVEEGAAVALEVSWAWLTGLLDGWDGERQTQLLPGASEGEYREGFRAGTVLWVELTAECSDCGARRYHRQERCPGCR